MSGGTDDDQCGGCDYEFGGGGFCDECVSDLQEQCAQEDVTLASYAAELARSGEAASVGETPDEYDVMAGPCLDCRDDVVRL